MTVCSNGPSRFALDLPDDPDTVSGSSSRRRRSCRSNAAHRSFAGAEKNAHSEIPETNLVNAEEAFDLWIIDEIRFESSTIRQLSCLMRFTRYAYTDADLCVKLYLLLFQK